MSVSLLTPQGLALGLAVVLPLAGFALAERHARLLRTALHVPEPRLRARLAELTLVCAIVALVAVAAAQPVLATERTQSVRSDAEAYFVFDISRSMLAAKGRGEPTRLERAKRLGIDLRRDLRDVPVGVASLTDRVLPHLFPTSDQSTFAATVERAIGIEQPPPAGFDIRATTLGALAGVATTGFFSRPAQRRLLVVFTDGETRPVFPARFAAALRRPPGIKLLIVQVWDANERIYQTGLPDPGYVSDPTSTRTIEALAGAAGGRVFKERELDAASRAARTFVGRGGVSTPVVVRGERALAPYVLALAFLPLLLLLWRRNGPLRPRTRPEPAGRTRRSPRRDAAALGRPAVLLRRSHT